MSAILHNHFALAVHDVRKSAQFYVDVLGFVIVNEPPAWIFVKKDDCLVMLGECPDDLPPRELGCYNDFGDLKVDDVDAYYAEVKAKGGMISTTSPTNPGACANSASKPSTATAS